MSETMEPMYTKYYGNTYAEVRKKAIHVLHEYGVHKVTAHYSGGHDEGGIDEFEEVLDKNGETVLFDGVQADDLDWSHPFRQALEDVLTTKFWSWALGASVCGRLNVDVEAKRIWTAGEIEQYVTDEDPIDWSW